MTTQYLMINQETNIVENIVVWDGNETSWQPPANMLMIQQESIASNIWVYDAEKKDFDLTEVLGAGVIGHIWDGKKLSTTETKPEAPKIEEQPIAKGLKTA